MTGARRAGRRVLLIPILALLQIAAAESQECGGGNPCGEGDTASQSSSSPASGAGNPIDITTGNKYVRETDVEFPGELSLSFTRHYNSAGVTGSAFGGGWSHSYETVLARATQHDGTAQITLLQGDGRRLKFVLSGPPAQGVQRFVSVPLGYGVIEERVEVIQQLSAGGSRRSDLGSLRPWIWKWRNGRQLSFDGRGIVQQIESPDSERLVLDHDAGGRLRRISDAHGRHAQLSYWDNATDLLVPFGAQPTATGEKHRVKSIALSDGRKIDYLYDANGLLSEVRYSDGTTRRYEYTLVGQGLLLSKRVGRDGALLGTYAYDGSGRAIYSSQGEGANAVRVEYREPSGQSELGESRVTSAGGAKTVYRWRRQGVSAPQLIEAQGPGCAVCPATNVRYRYGSDGLIVQIDRLSESGTTPSSEQFERDAQGRLTARHRVIGGERTLLERYGYASNDPLAQPTRIERPSVVADRLHTVEIEYSARGQVTQISERGWDPAGNAVLQPWSAAPVEIVRRVRAQYDRAGRLTQIDGPRTDVSDVLEIDYDERGRVQRIRAPDGSEQRILTYDAQGRPTQLARTGQPSMQLAYDTEGRLASVSESEIADARSVQYGYDARGRLTTIRSPDGGQTRIRYDAADRPTHMLDERTGRSTEVAYGSEQIEAVRLKDGTGQVLRLLAYSYDAQSRLTAVRDGTGRTLMQYGYEDADRAPDRLIDPLGLQSLLSYDDFGRLTQQQAPDGGITEVAYEDERGTQRISAPNGASTQYTYNDFGERIREDSADRGSTRYFYDEAGNLTAKVDARGKIQRYGYDASNRLQRIINAEGTTTLTYDQGRLTRIAGPWGEERYAYEARGRLTTHTRLIDGHDFTTAYAYDAQGRLSKKQLPGGETLNYHYDANGQLQAITQSRWWGQQTALIGRPEGDSTNERSSTLLYGNGLITQTTIDLTTGRIEQRTTQGVQRFNYQYDEAGRITGIDLDGQAHRYRYDAVGRLTNALTPGGEFDYAYDPNGNRLSEGKKDGAKKAQLRQTDYRYAPSSNRLTQAGDDRYTYDQTGNPLAIGERRYEYNSTGRPTKLFIDNQLKASYQYNAWGERIKKVVYSGNQQKVTYFFYDDHQLTAEANGDGEITQQYLYLGYAPVVTFIDGEAYFVHTDHLGTPRAITDEDQTVVWTAQYAPFGEAAVDEDPDRNTERVALNLRFPGQYEDLESGAYYNYFRDYDPQTGRYRTSDPIGLIGGTNTYLYANADTLALIDPLGLLVWRNRTTYAFDLTRGSLWSPVPGASPRSSRPKASGNTIVDWSISSRCECVGSTYKFKEFTVEFRTNVHIRPGLSGAEVALVKEKEADHIGDYVAWANGKGTAIAKEREIRYQTATFSSLEECEAATSSSLDGGLRNGGIVDAWHETVLKWDYPGGPHNH